MGFTMMPWPPVMAPGRAGSVTLFSTTLFACPLAILASSGTSAADSELAKRVALPAFDRYVTLQIGHTMLWIRWTRICRSMMWSLRVGAVRSQVSTRARETECPCKHYR